MANQEQLEILKQGVPAWNRWIKKWRKKHSNIDRPYLMNANLSHANLHGADLESVDFRNANLSHADLSHANLKHTLLSKADLSQADLGLADLTFIILDYANLRNADLMGAYLYGASLYGADLSHAMVGYTKFIDVDLSVVKNLEAVDHAAPSSIGIDTIYRSKGNIPEAFLKGAGVDDTFMTYFRSLVGKPFEYYSCFISYSSKDDSFAKRLYADLQNNNVRCWFAPEDMKIGDRIRPRIDESIRMYDRLLIVLSEHSVSSKWVEFEVEAAMDKEQEGKSPVLFPVRLDNTVMESATAWAAHIKRTRHIGDFSRWNNHDAYQKAFTRLLRDLKAEA